MAGQPCNLSRLSFFQPTLSACFRRHSQYPIFTMGSEAPAHPVFFYPFLFFLVLVLFPLTTNSLIFCASYKEPASCSSWSIFLKGGVEMVSPPLSYFFFLISLPTCKRTPAWVSFPICPRSALLSFNSCHVSISKSPHFGNLPCCGSLPRLNISVFFTPRMATRQ